MAAQPFDEWESYAKRFEDMTDKLSEVVAPVLEQLGKEGERFISMAAPVVEQFEHHARDVVQQQAERALEVISVLRDQLEKFVSSEQPPVD